VGAVYPVIWCPLDAATGKAIARPGHCRHVTAIEHRDGVGTPSGGPGTLWSAVPMEALVGEWRATSIGWWVNVGDIRRPGQLGRVRLMDGVTVAGALGICFMVPRLLRWQPEAGLVSALPSVWKDYTWVPVGELAPLIERLRAAVTDPGAMGRVVTDGEMLELAVDIIGLNYTGLSVHELAILGWIDTDLVREVILAAVGWSEMEGMIAEQLARAAAAIGGG
jgi:hypothetical protein